MIDYDCQQKCNGIDINPIMNLKTRILNKILQTIPKYSSKTIQGVFPLM